MPDLSASTGPKSIEVSAVLTRADGSVVDYGVISYYHKNPLKHLAFKLKLKLLSSVLARSK